MSEPCEVVRVVFTSLNYRLTDIMARTVNKALQAVVYIHQIHLSFSLFGCHRGKHISRTANRVIILDFLCLKAMDHLMYVSGYSSTPVASISEISVCFLVTDVSRCSYT